MCRFDALVHVENVIVQRSFNRIYQKRITFDTTFELETKSRRILPLN